MNTNIIRSTKTTKTNTKTNPRKPKHTSNQIHTTKNQTQIKKTSQPLDLNQIIPQKITNPDQKNTNPFHKIEKGQEKTIPE